MLKKNNTLISVVIPVYKAESCLIELYTRLNKSLEKITKSYEIILVEDCGFDGSWEKIIEIAKKDSRVKGIQLSRNFGQHYAITAGLDNCNGDWVVVMDCDLQDRPEEIPRLYLRAKEGFDVVLAIRQNRNDFFYKRYTSYFFYKIYSYFSGVEYDGKVGNFRIISRKVVNSLNEMREQLRFFSGMVAWMGFQTAIINAQHDKRYSGQSSYTYSKLLKLAIETIVSFSEKPLMLSIYFGFTIAIAAFFFGAYIIYSAFIYGSPIIGWSSLIVSIYFIGGIIMTILGIHGIYIGKLFNEAKKRPLYIISRMTL